MIILGTQVIKLSLKITKGKEGEGDLGFVRFELAVGSHF